VREQATVFGEVAELYELRRPTYPAALFAALLEAVPGARRALEAGAGTGKATAALARSGLAVEAVEPDPAMAAVARRVCAGLDVTVRAGRFEEWDGEAGAFDLVVSAQAWHWVDHDAGAGVAARALRPGGALAVWWNRPQGTRPGAAWRAVDAVYAREAPELIDKASARAAELPAPPADAFAPWERRSFPWTRDYGAREYAELIRTHSDHRLLEPERLDRLAAAVEEGIDAAGGRLTYAYRCDLALGRRTAG
jgi:SAM-dependent methyltransferase